MSWKLEPFIELPEGFELRQDDDHFVYLYCGNERVAVFNAATASVAGIKKECLSYLRKGRNGC